MRTCFKIFLLGLLLPIFAKAQLPAKTRGDSSLINIDYRLLVGFNLGIPVFDDTASALHGGKDVLGLVVQIRGTGDWYKRDTVSGGGHQWTKFGTGSPTDTSHLSSRINLKLDSVKRKVGSDSVFVYANGSQIFAFKDTVTLATILASLGYAPLAPTDTVYLHNTVASKKNNSDSVGPQGYASVGNLGRVRDSLLNLLANKMTNFGGAPGWLVGTYSGIPTASTYAAGTHYTAKDSGFIYIDTGSGGTAGWKKISGGGGGSAAGAVTNFLNSQQLGYGPYASKPTTGNGFYYASDSSSWFYINGATATNITSFNVWARQGISPLGTHGDSIQLGGYLGTFFQPDTIATAGQPFLITGLPSKSTTLITDSINVIDAGGQLWKAPVPSGGAGTSDTTVLYSSNYVPSAIQAANRDATTYLQTMLNAAATQKKSVVFTQLYVDSAELEMPTTGFLSVGIRFLPGATLSYASKTGAAIKWSGAAFSDISIENPQIKAINDTTSIGNNLLFFQSVTGSTTIRRVTIRGGVLSGGQCILIKGVRGMEVSGVHFNSPLGHDNSTTTTNPAVQFRSIADSTGDMNAQINVHDCFGDGFSQQNSLAVTSLKTGGRMDGFWYGPCSGCDFHDIYTKHYDQEHYVIQPGLFAPDSARTLLHHLNMDGSILPGSKAQGVAITGTVGIRAEHQKLTISGNQIQNATVGIQVYWPSWSAYPARNLVIDGNTISASQDTASNPVKGIQVQGFSAASPSAGATIKDNTILIDSVKLKATYQAFNFTYLDSSTIANNIVKQGRVTRSGGGIWGISTNTDTGLVVRNNTMQNVDTVGFSQASTIDSGNANNQIYAYAPLHVTTTGDTTYVDTTQTTTSGSHLVTQNMIALTHRLEFIDSIPGTTYQNDRLIGGSLLNVNVGGVDVGQIANASAYWSFNNSTGTVQLYNDTLQFGDRVIIQYKRPFVDTSTYSSIIGLIYSANSFSNLNAFYNNSPANAFSISGTQIVARSLGVGMWGDGGDYLDYNLFCNDENVYTEGVVRIGTQGDGLGFGIKYGPGQLDGASGSYGSVIGNFNIASLTVPKLYMWNQQTIIDSVTFPGTVAAGDSIKMRMTRTKGQFVFKVTDLNTSVTASDTATFNYTYPGNFIIPATGRMGIAKWGTGIDTIRSYTMYSNSVRSPWLVFIGDSKTTGYYSTGQSSRFAELAGLNALYQPFAVYSSPGDRTQDCVNALAYIVNYVHPKNVILCIGRNDISSFGAPFWAQGQYNYERITSTLEGSGARVIHLLPIPETTLNQTSLTTFISALVGSRNTIDPTIGFVNGTMLAGDGVHPNASGHAQVSTNIINQAKIHK